MMLPFALLTAMNMAALPPRIDIIDSRDNPKVTYIIVNETCKVRVNKAELKDYDRIIAVVMEKCGL